MPQTPHDAQLQERFAQLNVIVARRNEFLHEMFRMMRSKQDINSAFVVDEEEDLEFQMFLQRFDLEKDPEHGSISNLTDDDISFPIPIPPHPAVRSPSATVLPSVDSKPGTSTRTTRSRSRVAESAKSPSPILDLVDKPSSKKSDEPRLLPDGSSPNSGKNTPTQIEESDEDNDELDLIGSSKFPIDKERRPPQDTAPHNIGRVDTLSSKDGKDGIEAGIKLSAVEAQMSTSEASGLTTAEEILPEPLTASLINSSEEFAALKDELHVDVLEATSSAVQPINHEAMVVDEDEVQYVSQLDDTEGVQQDHISDASMDSNIDKMEITPDESAPSLDAQMQQRTTSPPQVVKYIPIHIPLPPSIYEPIIIPAPPIGIDEKPFNLNFAPEPEIRKPSSPGVDFRQQFDPQYTLPPLSALPPEFARKAKPARRKKEKEKERDKDGKRDKDDTLPLGLNRWGATVMANPVWKKVARASKCLSTREWGVAMAELRLIRTLERIDSLKNDGRWSFRQPKKQRGVGGLIKTHWDYLLDEMKLMRIDFREERRWKMALAYNLSTSVLEWHFAKTPEERQRAGVCVKWKPSHFSNHEDEISEAPTAGAPLKEQLQLMEQSNPPLLGVDYGSDDDDDDDQDKDQRSVIDSLEPSTLVEEALDSSNEIRLKSEEVDDQSALQLMQQIGDAPDAALENQDSVVNVNHGQAATDAGNGLKSTSDNPIFGGSKSSSQSTNGDIVPTKPSKSVLAPLRERIAYDDQLFVDFSVDVPGASSTPGTQESQPPDFLDLNTLFPDLQSLGLLDIPAAPIQADGKKRVEKKSDRDDPNRRIEDTTYTKLYPTGRFMYSKPTLLGPLQPSKRWKNGEWLPMEQISVAPDPESNLRVPEESSNELFDGRPTNSNMALQIHPSSLKDKESRKRVDHLWSSSDDVLLKSLIDKYSTNWALIAECYNSSRLTAPTDKRSPNDCAERWRERWAERKSTVASDVAQASGDDGSAPGASNQMTTRGVKRLASASVSNPIMQGSATGSEPKKRRRHVLIQESIKKAVKKRSDALQKMLAANQRKTPAVHETHNQYNKLPKLTPSELSRMKAERDLRDSQDLALARRRQEEQHRQNLMQQAQRNGVMPQQQQQQPPQAAQQPQPQPPPQQAQQPLQPQQQQQQFQQHQQQLAQLQQLQAQQQANQNQRQNAPPAVVPNRTARLPTTANARPVGQQQAQILQQARALQIPIQLQANAQNLPQALLPQTQVSGNSAAHPAGSAYYALSANLPNITQEQLLNFFATQNAQQQLQHQQPQGSAASNSFGTQP